MRRTFSELSSITARRPGVGGVLLIIGLFLTVFATAVWAQSTAEGNWTKKGFAVSGQWQIVSEGGAFFLELPQGFSTKKAPDLKLFLSHQTVGELSNRTATKGAVLIAPLESPRGAQRYKLPQDPAKFKTLVLHCEKYSKLWAVAPLR